MVEWLLSRRDRLIVARHEVPCLFSVVCGPKGQESIAQGLYVFSVIFEAWRGRPRTEDTEVTEELLITQTYLHNWTILVSSPFAGFPGKSSVTSVSSVSSVRDLPLQASNI